MCLSVWSVLDRVPCALEKNVYSEFCGCNVLKISIKSNCSVVPFRIFFALLIFYLEDLSTDVSRVLKSPAIVAVLSMSPFMSVRICLCIWVCLFWVLVKAMVFPVVMYACESWTVKKAERLRIDAFELWCWRRLLRVPWTARRSIQSTLKEISPGSSLEGLMLKLKLQYFGHLM